MSARIKRCVFEGYKHSCIIYIIPLPFALGRFVHYGRAELKQSDHRPVLAVIDVEGCTVIDSKLASTYESVVASLGPSDCTVVVQVS